MSVHAWSASPWLESQEPVNKGGIDHERLQDDTEKYFTFPPFDKTSANKVELVWNRTTSTSQPDSNNFTATFFYHGNFGEIHRDQQYLLSFPPEMINTNKIDLELFNKYRSLAPIFEIKGDDVCFILSNLKANNREDGSDPENAYCLRLIIGEEEVYENNNAFTLIKKVGVGYREVLSKYKEMAEKGELINLKPPRRKGKPGPKKKKKIVPSFYRDMEGLVKNSQDQTGLSLKGLVKDPQDQTGLNMDKLIQNFVNFRDSYPYQSNYKD